MNFSEYVGHTALLLNVYFRMLLSSRARVVLRSHIKVFGATSPPYSHCALSVGHGWIQPWIGLVQNF